MPVTLRTMSARVLVSSIVDDCLDGRYAHQDEIDEEQDGERNQRPEPLHGAGRPGEFGGLHGQRSSGA
jgi:hypothetical protein